MPATFKRPRKIFVCSMGDLFHEDVPDEWIDAVFKVTTLIPQHKYLFLTKRPEQMRYYIGNIVDKYNVTIPSNLWFGVTAENQQMADERIPILIDTPVPNRFISVEPMLSAVDLSKYINQLDWVITGGETGVKARNMQPEWAVMVKNLCVQNGVPFFFKEMARKAPKPAELMVVEFPLSLK